MLAALLPLVFGLCVVFTFFYWRFPVSYASRTIPGLVKVPFAISGVVVPLLLIIKRVRFVRLQPKQQWIALGVVVFVMPVGYFLALDKLDHMSRYSTAVIPYSQRIILRYQPSLTRPPLQFYIPGRIGGGWGGSTSQDGMYTPKTFEAYWTPGHRRPTGAPDVEMRFAGWQTSDDRHQVTVELQTRRNVRLRFEHLVDIQITRNGEAVSEPIDLEPGNYKFVISGRPE